MGTKTPSCSRPASPGTPTHTLPGPGSSFAVSGTIDGSHDKPCSALAFSPQVTVLLGTAHPTWGHLGSAFLAGILALAAPWHREHIMNVLYQETTIHSTNTVWITDNFRLQREEKYLAKLCNWSSKIAYCHLVVLFWRPKNPQVFLKLTTLFANSAKFFMKSRISHAWFTSVVFWTSFACTQAAPNHRDRFHICHAYFKALSHSCKSRCTMSGDKKNKTTYNPLKHYGLIHNPLSCLHWGCPG